MESGTDFQAQECLEYGDSMKHWAQAGTGGEEARPVSVVRRYLVAQAAEGGAALGRLLAQVGHFAHQPVYLLLLAHDDLVELFQHVVRKAGLDLQLQQAAFDVLQVIHGGY